MINEEIDWMERWSGLMIQNDLGLSIRIEGFWSLGHGEELKYVVSTSDDGKAKVVAGSKSNTWSPAMLS